MHKPSYLFICFVCPLIYTCIDILNVQHITSTTITIIRAIERWTVYCHAGAHGIVSWSLRNNVGGKRGLCSLHSKVFELRANYIATGRMCEDETHGRSPWCFVITTRNISRNLQRKISPCKPASN